MYLADYEDDDLEGFWSDIWGGIKQIPEKIKGIKPETAMKAGEIVGAFQAGKKRRRRGGAADPSLRAPSPVIQEGSTSALPSWALYAGLGLGAFLILRRTKVI